MVQWGLAYAAGAWVLLQVLDFVTDDLRLAATGAADRHARAAIGLPIVVVLAWYHGDRGQQRVSAPELAILTLLLLLGGGVFWYYQRASETATVTSPPPSSAPP